MNNNSTEQLNVRVDTDLIKKLEATSTALHCGKGTIVAQALEQYFERRDDAASQQQELIARVEALEARLEASQEAAAEPASSSC
jgi:predicted transcriptional regulator